MTTSTTSADKKEAVFAWGLLLVLAIIWGSSFILYKKGLVVFGPGQVGALRILSAALVLLPITIKHLSRVSAKQRLYLFISGMVGSFIPAFLFAIAQTKINSSLSGILNAMTPFFVLLVGLFFFNQRIQRQAVLGLLLGFAGTIVLVTAGSANGARRFPRTNA